MYQPSITVAKGIQEDEFNHLDCILSDDGQFSRFTKGHLDLTNVPASDIQKVLTTSCKESYCSLLCLQHEPCLGYQMLGMNDGSCVCSLISANVYRLPKSTTSGSLVHVMIETEPQNSKWKHRKVLFYQSSFEEIGQSYNTSLVKRELVAGYFDFCPDIYARFL